MNENLTSSLIFQAAMPGILLAATGLVWLRLGKSFRAMPATMFSLGVALLALMSLILIPYGISRVDMLQDFALAALWLTPLNYVALLIGCVRIGNVSARSAAVLGMLGLVPLWFLGGFVLMNTVCSISSGGC